MTVADAVKEGTERLTRAGVDTPRLDSQLLLIWVLSCRREDLAREPERVLDVAQESRFLDVLDRRERRVPLPYITGEQHFYRRLFHVDSSVLIPRPETELLVKMTLDRIAGIDRPRVVDVGTGSGCIAVAVAAERPDALVTAVDLSPEALAVATGNAKLIGVVDRVDFRQGDLLSSILASPDFTPFHAVVSNPPYVTEEELSGLEPEVRDFEPRLALSGLDAASGPTGTDLYPVLFQQSMRALFEGGWVLVEIGQGQDEVVCAAAAGAGFVDVHATPDFAGIPRVVAGRKASLI